MHSKQRGFTAAAGVFIVILVALLAGGGWYVWHKNQSKDNAKKAADTSQKQAAAEQSQVETPEHLVIKEWGVRFAVSENNAGAYYLIKAGLPNYAYLSTTSLNVDDCGADKTTLGVYARFKEGDRDELSGELMTDVYRDAAKLGDYYYYYQHPQAACSDNQTTLQKAGDAMTAFGNNIDSVEVISAQ